MDFYDLTISQEFVTEVTDLMNFYDFKYDIKPIPNGKIIRKKKSGLMEYKTVEDFLLGEIFYKNKKNLHYYHIVNPANTVCNFDISPYDIVSKHPLLKHMMNHSIYKKIIFKIHNYGTFIRFSENKIQRLYWNPPLNAGIPLTAKEKDPVYELIFLMHDFGHFVLPDLVPSGETNAITKKIYVNWRLLGESITVVLNEMLLVDYLKDKEEFNNLITIDFDKPYKLYQIFRRLNLSNKNDLYKLFHASYLYFCILDNHGFIELIDKENNTNWEQIWSEFDNRYHPVAARGRDWTESNFDNIAAMAKDYEKWYNVVKPMKHFLELKTIYDLNIFAQQNEKIGDITDIQIMDILFINAFENTIVPLFSETLTETSQNILYEPHLRKLKSFIRYMVGNLFLLVKHDEDSAYKFFVKLNCMDTINLDKQMADIYSNYLKIVEEFYLQKKISMNEYHNYKNIFIMIPPNILKKDAY
jgi:hypothetical protein